jgi:hypothetical protein
VSYKKLIEIDIDKEIKILQEKINIEVDNLELAKEKSLILIKAKLSYKFKFIRFIHWNDIIRQIKALNKDTSYPSIDLEDDCFNGLIAFWNITAINKKIVKLKNAQKFKNKVYADIEL